MLKRFFKRLAQPRTLARINGLAIIIAIVFNICFQVFCVPVLWAEVLLYICFANTILYPLLEDKRWQLGSSFISGISFSVTVYCAIFLEVKMDVWEALFAMMFVVGFLIFMPHFFAIQLFWKNIIRPVHAASRYYFLAGFLVCVLVALAADASYKHALASMERFKQSNYQRLEKNFMTEKILGMHFIYHTCICYYDGWRPPLHDPLLIIGMWFNDMKDPLDMTLYDRLSLYKKFYPNKQYLFTCSCAIEGSGEYHNDKLWK